MYPGMLNGTRFREVNRSPPSDILLSSLRPSQQNSLEARLELKRETPSR